MAILATPGHVSAKPCSSFTCPLAWTAKAKRKLLGATCALSPLKWRESRRLTSISIVLSPLLFIPNHAIAGSFLDKYVKKKKLEPLEVYVPAIILTQSQIKELENFLGADQPQYASCRSLLRYGPAASLRVNIRAVAQYAVDNGNGKIASDDVDQCLRALEELDSLLLHASRNDPEASIALMKGKIDIALSALDSLLHTVPSDVLEKGNAVADSYRNTEDVEPEILDREMQQLESIL
ncbi:hypothetical protein CJ030_MR3G009483 [Morella rubra]|uniref:DUF7880 domain-containing protein n=1 Tax=Morella rubra TaxID=262757 RepID=A0A6A1W3P3_9ROSI|nr:hypothetical protein CJ030_MR3G009483 [Morella rubra]